MKQLVDFFKKPDESTYRGVIYQPPVERMNKKDITFFDALFMGIPVEVNNGLKIIDNTIWEKVVSVFSHKEIHDLTFKKILFTNVIFEGISFTGCIFENCQIQADWIDGQFDNCTFKSCSFANFGIRMWRANKSQFKDCSFEESTVECDMKDVYFEKCCFHKATIYTSMIRDSSFNDCDFSFSYLRKNLFHKSKLTAPNFLGATINGTRFASSEITDANYENIYITMGGATHDEIAHLKHQILKAFTPALN